MSDHENPAEQTQQLPKFPPRPTDTAQMPVLLIREHPVADEPEPAPPPAPSRAGRGLRIGLALAGLVGVATLSGGLWLLLAGRGAETPGTPVPATTVAQGEYEFTQQVEQRDTNCAAHAYGKVKDFLSGRPCDELVQLLLTTKSKEGADVVVALSVVRMPDTDGAVALKALTDTDNTGNINDLLREGKQVPNGPSQLTRAGYAAAQDGRAVVIAEADFFDVDRSDETLLRRIAQDSLRIGHKHAN
ncbi:hypothetical protein LX15_000576 [Streptoalloteichus tenebrarius]|uniref:Uncharacterized protein n=1 Tax=Streptoalloteichus tenebrarius (strain ATCC 17920 / DSM 40477 / JCM 4838 / CBS 697.72 / NBRC 16177 / NCIMB 11028 / NRRL B-12390 / A12253. 1 / ISP 5477) TaxID=1933 RepID=A0ABT1HN02_STRSD|nr:hypothetical protein [Streptoalloteichus tenebrarius]MCP2256893.1 hypothetical protein [Streptoalloteichus tenebrarius]BFF00199.1 hypothetical protein GCM10020241_18740 [Streptoalloteichus tenebrarius]